MMECEKQKREIEKELDPAELRRQTNRKKETYRKSGEDID